jgi:hypothetical protein
VLIHGYSTKIRKKAKRQKVKSFAALLFIFCSLLSKALATHKAPLYQHL